MDSYPETATEEQLRNLPVLNIATQSVFTFAQKASIATACVATLLLVLLTTLIFERRYNQQGFEESAQELHQNINHIISASEGVITTLSGVFQTEETLDRYKLAAISEQLFAAYPFIPQIFKFQIIYAEERDEFEARMGSSGYYNFQIKALDPDSKQLRLRMFAERYAPVVHIEPNDPLLSRQVGVDLFSHAEFSVALPAAIESADLELMALSLKPQGNAVLAVLRPTYFGHYIPEQLNDRHDQLEGGFIATVALEAALDPLVKANRFSDVNVVLRQPNQSGTKDTLIYRSTSESRSLTSPLFEPFEWHSELKVGSRVVGLNIAGEYLISNTQISILVAALMATALILWMLIRLMAIRVQQSMQLHQLVENLESKQKIIDKDEQLAKAVFQKIIRAGTSEPTNVDNWHQSMSSFSGDVVLNTIDSTGRTYVMVCDFTGHGLPAALGALPVSTIFYAMAGKGAPVADIITEMNEKLLSLLPTEYFCCATLIVFDPGDRCCAFWNGGLPPLLQVSAAGKIVQSFSGNHLPLGVSRFAPSDAQPKTIVLAPRDSLYTYTDGLTEALNAHDEMYSEARLVNTLGIATKSGRRINIIRSSVESFMAGTPASDDISIVELTA